MLVKSLKNILLFIIRKILAIIIILLLLFCCICFIIFGPIILFFIPVECIIMKNTKITDSILTNLSRYNFPKKIVRFGEYINNVLLPQPT